MIDNTLLFKLMSDLCNPILCTAMLLKIRGYTRLWNSFTSTKWPTPLAAIHQLPALSPVSGYTSGGPITSLAPYLNVKQYTAAQLVFIACLVLCKSTMCNAWSIFSKIHVRRTCTLEANWFTLSILDNFV